MLQPSAHVAGAHWKTLLLAAQSALVSIAFIHLFPPTDFDLLCGSVHRERTGCAFASLFNPFDISTDPPASGRDDRPAVCRAAGRYHREVSLCEPSVPELGLRGDPAASERSYLLASSLRLVPEWDRTSAGDRQSRLNQNGRP